MNIPYNDNPEEYNRIHGMCGRTPVEALTKDRDEYMRIARLFPDTKNYWSTKENRYHRSKFANLARQANHAILKEKRQ